MGSLEEINLIPKIIHYVWVGGPKPEWVQKNIDGWRRVLTDYTFQEWNEHNWDISQSQFAKYFYDKKKFGFVGDPIRIDVLNRIGGIYLDTDVEVYKSFDSLLQEKLVFSRIYNNALGTATILAEKNTKMMGDLAQMYDAFSLSDLQSEKVDKVSNGIFTRYLLDKHVGFSFGNTKQRLKNDALILPKQYFEVPAMWFETGTFATHHVAGSWQDKKQESNNESKGLKSGVKGLISSAFPAAIARYENLKGGQSNSIAKEFGPKAPQ